MDVQNVNRTFPRYPVTIEDKGWVYGVWYCGTKWQRGKLHGEYPSTFLRRALALFPDAADILHCPSGTVDGPGVTVDIHSDLLRRPAVRADAANLPFDDNSFDLILSDPPYSAKDSEIYQCGPFPMHAFMQEARRVLRPGGHLGILHVYYPSYSARKWKITGIIAVITGFCRVTRAFSVFRSTKKWSWSR